LPQINLWIRFLDCFVARSSLLEMTRCFRSCGSLRGGTTKQSLTPELTITKYGSSLVDHRSLGAGGLRPLCPLCPLRPSSVNRASCAVCPFRPLRHSSVSRASYTLSRRPTRRAYPRTHSEMEYPCHRFPTYRRSSISIRKFYNSWNLCNLAKC
jgi:hypothetical protein